MRTYHRTVDNGSAADSDLHGRHLRIHDGSSLYKSRNKAALNVNDDALLKSCGKQIRVNMSVDGSALYRDGSGSVYYITGLLSSGKDTVITAAVTDIGISFYRDAYIAVYGSIGIHRTAVHRFCHHRVSADYNIRIALQPGRGGRHYLFQCSACHPEMKVSVHFSEVSAFYPHHAAAQHCNFYVSGIAI